MSFFQSGVFLPRAFFGVRPIVSQCGSGGVDAARHDAVPARKNLIDDFSIYLKSRSRSATGQNGCVLSAMYVLVTRHRHSSRETYVGSVSGVGMVGTSLLEPVAQGMAWHGMASERRFKSRLTNMISFLHTSCGTTKAQQQITPHPIRST